MAIESDNPINEEVEIEEEAVVTLPSEEGEEEITEETDKTSMKTLQKLLMTKH
jgi:hypothetical protein